MALRILALVVFIALAHGNETWSYRDGEGEPNNWPELFPTCKGTRQSPINIKSVDATPSQSPSYLQMFSPLNSTDGQLTMVLQHGGVFKVGQEQRIVLLSGSDLPAPTYVLAQVHWHSPSEHTINGKRFAAERHMVFVPTDAATRDQLGLAWRYVVLGTVYDEDLSDGAATNDAALRDVIPLLDKLNANATVSLDMSTPLFNGTSVYRYNGSLTTPPCTEAVSWYVSAQPRTLSPAHLGIIRNWTTANAGPQALGSARPIQETEGRSLAFRSYFSTMSAPVVATPPPSTAGPAVPPPTTVLPQVVSQECPDGQSCVGSGFFFILIVSFLAVLGLGGYAAFRAFKTYRAKQQGATSQDHEMETGSRTPPPGSQQL